MPPDLLQRRTCALCPASPAPRRPAGFFCPVSSVETGDITPILYLVAKHCGDRQAARDEALERVQSLLSELPGLLSAAGAGHVRSKTKK